MIKFKRMKCKDCDGHCLKNGFQNNGKQRYRCSQCGKRQQENYVYNRYNWSKFENFISKLVKNGMGIRNIARIMEISINTVVRSIKRIAKKIKKPSCFKYNQKYQVDEMRTFIKNKKEGVIWLFYALNKETKTILDFTIGRRTSENAKKITEKLFQLVLA